MTRLAVRLALRGGRSGLVRVGLIAIALAAGSAMLIVSSWVLTAGVARNDRVETRRGGPLASVGMFLHRTQGAPLNSVTSGRPFVIWSKTSLSAPRARTITAFGVAPSGPDAPRPPGVRAIPKPGTALASPALQALLDSREGASLRAALPARVVGTVGNELLRDPRELVVVTGYDIDTLQRIDPGAYLLESFGRRHTINSLVFVVPITVLATLVLLLPLLVFVGSAARVGARRREERLATMRLIGATPGQARLVAAVETGIAGIIGMAAGIALALATRAWLVAHRTYAPGELPTSGPRLVALALVVPFLSTISAPLALRRIGMSPLGVDTRKHRRTVSPWRWWLLALGWTLFVSGALMATSGDTGGWRTSASALLLTGGVVGVALGLIGAGPWLVQQGAQLAERRATRPSSLLAAARLSEDPRAGFRPVTVLVVTVFVATMLIVLIPAARRSPTTTQPWPWTQDVTARPDLQITWNPIGADAALAVATARDRLTRVQGVEAVVPLHAGTLSPQTGDLPSPWPGAYGHVVVADCTTFAALVHGSSHDCRSGVLTAVASGYRAGDSLRLGPSLSLSVAGQLPLLDRAGVLALVPGSIAPPQLRDLHDVSTLWLRTDGSRATALRVQGVILAVAPGSTLEPGRTFQYRSIWITTTHWLLYGVLLVVLLLAACSLAVTVVDQIFDRRRSLATLRAVGTPLSLLRRATMLEVGAPLVTASVLGAINGAMMGFVFTRLNGNDVVVPWLDVLALPALIAGAWLAVSAVGLAALRRAAPPVPLRAT